MITNHLFFIILGVPCSLYWHITYILSIPLTSNLLWSQHDTHVWESSSWYDVIFGHMKLSPLGTNIVVILQPLIIIHMLL